MEKEKALQIVNDFIGWFNGPDLLHAVQHGHAAFVHRKVIKLEKALRKLKKRSSIVV